MRRLALATALVLALSASGSAGPDKPVKAKLSDVMKTAFGLRRAGKLAAAGLAFEEVLGRLKPESQHRPTIALELAQLYVVMGKPYRAILVYRKIKDVPHEVETLLGMKDARYHREALVVSRHVKYPLGEARALAKLGKAEEAIAVLEKAGPAFATERGKLLLKQKRNREAAKAFKSVNYYLGMARATQLIDRDQARRLFEDSAADIEHGLKHEWIPKLKAAQKRLKQAEATGRIDVARERARIYYAQILGLVGQQYRSWALSFEGARQKAKAVKRIKKAIGIFRTQRNRLVDRQDDGSEPDAFGKKAVVALGVAKAIADAEAALARCEALPD